MRHFLSVVFVALFAPLAGDAFRPWPSIPDKARDDAPSGTSALYPLVGGTGGNVGHGLPDGVVILGSGAPHRLEPYGSGYRICPGEVSAVSTIAIGFEPFK